MPRLFKNLSSKEIVKILERFGFVVVSQKGSHIKMVGLNGIGGHVIIQERKDMPQGTLRNIYNQATQIIGDGTLDKDFKNF